MSVRIAALAAVLLGTLVVPGRAAAAVLDPPAAAPIFATRGWTGIAHASGTSIGSDVDSDQSTVNSSRDTLTIPPGATIAWAGLHWGGDQARRADGSPAHCAASPDPATPPAKPDATTTVQMSIADSPYQTVTAEGIGRVTTSSGASAYQAYANITNALRPFGGKAAPTPIPITVANVQVATGPGCVGGWSVVLVYQYAGGPDKSYAPAYESVAVYDPILLGGDSRTLTGIVTPASGNVPAGLTATLLTGGPPVGLTLNAAPVAAGAPGGYTGATAPLTLAVGSQSATYGIAGAPDSFEAAVFAVAAAFPATVSLPVTATFEPAQVTVGSVAQLTLTVRNDSDLADPGVTVTAKLPDAITVVQAGPAYNATTGLWTVGTVEAHTTARLNVTVRVNKAGTFTSTAQVSASALQQTSAAPPSPATILAETLAPPPTTPSTTDSTAPASVGAAPVDTGLDLPPAGILVGLGVFGLGLVMFLAILVRRRDA
jgi:hypothetical protein